MFTPYQWIMGTVGEKAPALLWRPPKDILANEIKG